MNAMLPSEYFGQTVEGWLASEKIDGIRALWDGAKFVSRNGLEFAVPDWFLAGMPDCPLDGEFFAGSLGATISATQAGRWEDVRFHVFDAPSAAPFRQRAATVATMALPAHCAVVTHWKVDTIGAMRQAEAIAANGGEGLVVRDPRKPYVSGRTDSALKIKPTRCAEMVVTGSYSKGLIGDWLGVVVRLNTAAKVAIGEVVTFAFSGVTDAGIPRCTSFVAVRNYE